MRVPYEFVDHTADYALRAWGRDFRELLENAARGLVALMGDTEGLAPQAFVEVAVTGDTEEDVLVHALKEVLYLQDEGLLAVAASVPEADAQAARLRLGTVALAEHRDRLGAAVKAVTYHALEIEQTETGLVVQVVLDT